jgi:hypothetical protein
MESSNQRLHFTELLKKTVLKNRNYGSDTMGELVNIKMF